MSAKGRRAGEFIFPFFNGLSVFRGCFELKLRLYMEVSFYKFCWVKETLSVLWHWSDTTLKAIIIIVNNNE